MIRLRTLGESIIEVDGVPYTPQYDTLFAALVYLTAERGRRVQRETLAGLLWPHHDESRGRHCLRQLLYRMRVAGCPVEGARDTLLLPESLVMPTFSAAPAAERLVAERVAGTLVIGPFLPGYVPPFSDALVEWLERTRGALDARVRRVLLEVAHAHKLRGEWDQVDVLAAEVLRIDPLNEEATLVRAEATAMVGAKTEAVEMLDRFMAELGPDRAQLQLPAAVLRRRIAERFPARRFGGTSDQVFVGRADLMESLSTALLRARKSEGGGVLLTGAPGSGKTRLIHELTTIAAMQGVRVVRADLSDMDHGTPLAAFTDVVPQLRALKGAIGVSPQALGFLSRLTDESTVTQPSEDARDPRWIALRIRQAILELCEAVTGENTVLLVIEDVQWMDASSWAVIDALLPTILGRRLLLVLTSRGLQLPHEMPQRCAERLVIHRVKALSNDAAIALARAIAAGKGQEFSEEALRWCATVGEGNPLFVRELVTHRLDGGPTGSMPPSLQALLDARIRRLGERARHTLEAAAVLGTFASTDRVGSALQLPAHELAAALNELTTEELIAPGTTMISARHQLLTSRVLDLTAAPVKRLLHERAATVLADRPDAAPDALLAAASHWQNAGDPRKGLETLVRAAHAAQGIGAVREAIRLLEVALEAAGDVLRRSAILRLLIPLLVLDHQVNRAAAAADQLCGVGSAVLDPDLRASDELLAIDAHYRAGAPFKPLIARSERLARDIGCRLPLRVRAARLAMNVAIISGFSFDRGLVAALLEHAARKGSREHRDLLNLSVIFEANFGDLRVAVTLGRELFDLAFNDRDGSDRWPHMLNVGYALYYAGLNAEAYKIFERVRMEAQAAGGRHFVVRSAMSLLDLAIDKHDLDDASRLSQLARAQVARERSTLDALLPPAEIRLAVLDGSVGRAKELAATFLEHTRSAVGVPVWQLREVLTAGLEAHLASSEGAVPTDLVAELLELHRRMQLFPVHDRTAAALILALERQGREDDARELERDYVTNHRRSLVPWQGATAILPFATSSTGRFDVM